MSPRESSSDRGTWVFERQGRPRSADGGTPPPRVTAIADLPPTGGTLSAEGTPLPAAAVATVAAPRNAAAAVPTGRRLRAVEVVEAAVLVDLVIAICLVARFVPLGWVLTIPAAVPAAALSARWRLRTAVTATFAAVMVAVLIGGAGFAVTVTSCMMIGTMLGTAHRRRWGIPRTALVAVVVLWTPVALAMDALFGVLTELRALVLAEIVNSWDGARAGIARLGVDPDTPVLAAADSMVRWGVAHWWVLLPLALLANTAVNVLAAAVVTRPVLCRLATTAPSARVDHPDAAWAPGGGSQARHPHPLPVRLESVTYRYPDSADDALRDVSLTIRPAEFVAIVGGNGSGKSTLARVIGGWNPTRGHVLRPGDCALGRSGGTSMIFQRPESQVLGVRVRDDVVWGLADGGRTVDVDALLDRVGLAQFADTETAALSGGQLQRLAVAAALARAPRLIVSDESTAMVDDEGSHQLTELLARLPGEEGVTVVHVTHCPTEARRAHRQIVLDRGRLMFSDGAPGSRTTSLPADPLAGSPGYRRGKGSAAMARPTAGSARDGGSNADPALVRLNGVGHVYSPGSPWAHRALADISFSLGAGEAVLVRGRNGSGKSSLAGVLAGLFCPSEGEALLAGRPLTGRPGEIGLAVQHSRLQLLAPTVGADVCAAAGVDEAAADEALAAVGLDPARFRHRRVESLSGGQMRRAALAGLIARRPRLMILDEPFAGLDTPSRRALVKVLTSLRAHGGMTLVVVSHDFDDLIGLTDRMLVLDAGRLVHDGPFDRGTLPSRSRTLPLPRLAPEAEAAGPACTAARAPAVAAPREPAPAAAAARGVETEPGGGSARSTSALSEPLVAEQPDAGRTGRSSRRVAGAGCVNRTEPNLLRYIPGTSPVHQLWAGTKIIVMAALGLLITVRPSWPVIGMVAGFVTACMFIARIPLGAAPRLPRWFWYGLAVGAALTIQSRQAPFMHLGGVTLSLGGVLDWLRLTSVSATMFAAAALVGWTTPMSELAPALSRLLAPLRRLRLPVDEWVATVALAIRCLPLLVDEVRTLLTVRRLRAQPRPDRKHRLARMRRLARPRTLLGQVLPGQIRCTVELLCTATVTCLRRAAEMTDAISARGGFGAIAHQPARPRRADAAALTILSGLFATALLVV